MTEYTTQVDVSGEDFIGKADIKFSIELEERSWGIKGICVSVPDQTISVETQDIDKEVEIKDVEVDHNMAIKNGWVTLHDLAETDGKWEAY